MTARILLTSAAALALTACNQAPSDVSSGVLDPALAEVAAPDMPQADRQLLWGDTHVHTINSVDAFSSGLANADIDSAYRFARGMPVIFPRTGQRVQIDRPLDFVVIADHAVSLGISSRIARNDPSIMQYPIARRLRELFETEGGRALTTAGMGGSNLTEEELAAFNRDMRSDEVLAGSWQGQIDAAERHNRPGTFTALIGWEWTFAPNLRNMHRVVFTNVDGDQAGQFLPLANYQTDGPEDLYAFFEETRARTGADFVAIPHNSNLSEGRMFELVDKNGDAFDAAYAQTRAAWEPVVEITQYKGSSETHPALSSNDEFADFELRNMLLTGVPTDPLGGSYVRSALLMGMAEEQRIGANPFRYGIIGASDSHTGFSSQLENNFLGKLGEDYLPADRLGDNKVPIIFPAAQMSASGLAGVWADHNDRQSLFDAFRRREVFGTSGPRMSVRLFAGYDFAAGDQDRRDFASHGYRLGVPMGGVLAPSNGRAPRLMIQAVKDPEAGNLDRVQVVKGWVDARGRTHEKIFNVAWSGGRSMRADGSLPAVGNTVDLTTARYTNTIGAAELATVWTDPEFDPSMRTFYYVRVLEIPTPRHHLFDALALGIDPATIDIVPTIQERAWSSPVWYTP
ncbi:DUF3604 domain-containing protein [Alteraurantiacibacter aestuarii]|uniref:DUF3604 domain-containing protein n=1 Tax=Alteraurantiacibacter aestuarii TaxID=650004 RepID=A0A844ZHQ8_9SPHN|nr:DUF3604 domain-containing protein [Alteraurantiacibacter aestuarii]MXO87318.1 DUF3604 domain-containing protein [Alteraurantiacibacter aestuarii]